MAQSTIQLNTVPFRLITLTILPYTPVQSSVNQIGATMQIPIPSFNHVPITPVILPNQVNNISNGNTLEEKEQRRLQKLREAQSRYRDKTNPYIEIANIPEKPINISQIGELIYHQLKVLEAQNILLSAYGNHNTKNTSQGQTPEKYYIDKDEGKLFDIENIIRAMDDINLCFISTKTWSKSTSYGLKHVLERWRRKILFNDRFDQGNPYITNGDFIMAMMLLGHDYRFKL